MRKKLEGQVRLDMKMPVTLKAKMDLLLWSDVEQRVPYGRVTEYVLGLIQKDVESRAKGLRETEEMV